MQKAKDAFAKLGANHAAQTDPQTKRVLHLFRMPQSVRDADLDALPDPPFAFGLLLLGTQVTDAGLKTIAARANHFDLSETRVTDAGLKSLQGCPA